ncbi:MAG: hypothetical protein HN855_01850 [Anaerolineae bacterium]|jgi:hypothetical protein|nr:hypothetical protein [Anaerolineae bacterium]MBT7071566.1 hypothetical protein [Anaerolineae bacterium]MBT7323881.1 hypothetical protein [Anaerolineae bacterium]
MFDRILQGLNWLFYILALSLVLGGGAVRYDVERDYYYDYTRGIKFDFPSWIADASWIKVQQVALGSPYYSDRGTRKMIVIDYLRQMDRVFQVEWELSQIYSNPEIPDPEAASVDLRARLNALYAEQRRLAPFAESILEEQVSVALAEAGLTSGGQPLPRPLYHISPLPMALIVSPREVIRQDENISLLADLPVDEQAALEERIAEELDRSALVVPIGGVGIYPTMGMRSIHLPWIVDTIAHEWMHNYLTWHPLGSNYGTTPELRTMNETVASIVGTEIGRIVQKRYYPESLASERPPVDLLSLSEGMPSLEAPPFDFNTEMRETRLRVDELLADGKVDEAEAYMEARRAIFWENGYAIRKLNQAYFAFHGAYADVPGGAAGVDPVGAAVRALREQSDSLADFVHTIMWLDSFEALEAMVD